jgi:membrane associated rhomboid family serine protease
MIYRPAVLPLHDDNPTRRPAVVTIALILACVLVYFFVQPSPGSTTTDDVRFDLRHAMIPLEVRSGDPVTPCQIATRTCGAVGADAPVVPDKQIYLAVIESMFLHGSIAHLLGNVLFLWIFGNNVEDRLGRVRYLLFYLAAGIVAAVGYLLVNWSSASPLLGASGAIAGVMGAYLVWFPKARILTLLSIIPLRLPAWLVLAGWFVLQFFTSPTSQVAWVAHVSGFVFGIVVGLLLRDRVAPRLPPPAALWPPPTPSGS